MLPHGVMRVVTGTVTLLLFAIPRLPAALGLVSKNPKGAGNATIALVQAPQAGRGCEGTPWRVTIGAASGSQGRWLRKEIWPDPAIWPASAALSPSPGTAAAIR
jgi:hypothetical protein